MSTEKEEWIGVSDMMAGLMMVFLFISVVFIEQINAEKASIEKIALTYVDYRDLLQQALLQEFEGDMLRWDAEILEDSTIRFNEPEVLFDRGSSAIKPLFAEILSDFFPRYISVLASEEFRDRIDEVRIEGHTSSIWDDRVTLRERYLNNAKLSQERSFAILEYCFALPAIIPERKWLTSVLRANGLAFARPIMIDGEEDMVLSRRVEFRVKTQAEERIQEIIKTIRE